MSVSSTAVVVTTPAGPRDVPGTLHMVAELPGLPGHVDYTLEPLDESGVVFTLRSAPPGLRPVRLFLAEPHAFFPGYAPRVPAATLESLGLSADDEPVLLVVVHPADEDHATPSANLLAPVVVAGPNGCAVQVVLDDDLPLRAPLG